MKRKNSLVDYWKFLEEEIAETVILLHIMTVFHLNYRLYGKEKKSMEKKNYKKQRSNKLLSRRDKSPSFITLRKYLVKMKELQTAVKLKSTAQLVPYEDTLE